MRIDGIHYEREPNVEELRNIRGHLMERHARILADIALVNAAIDRKTQDVPFDAEREVVHALMEEEITPEQAFSPTPRVQDLITQARIAREARQA